MLLHEASTDKFTIIPENTEKIRTLVYKKIFAFKDSFSFQPASLCSLSKRLLLNNEKNGKELKIIKQIKSLTHSYENGKKIFCPQKFKTITQKLIFPYHLATSLENLNSITSFPSITEFNNNILKNEAAITKKEYEDALYIFQLYQFENLSQYYMHYCLIGM